jgi:phage shock protein A
MTTFFLVLISIALILFFINKISGKRIFDAFNAQISKHSKMIYDKDPRAIMQLKIDEASEEIRLATKSLEQNKALASSLSRQISDCQTDINRLKGRIKSCLSDDPEDKTGKASTLALQLQSAEENLAKNQSQFDIVNKMYENNLKKIHVAQVTLREAEERSRQLGIQLEMAKTMSAISDLGSKCNLNISSIDGLSEAEESIKKQIDSYTAKADVLKDLKLDGVDEFEEMEREKKEKADSILDQIRKEMK